tara:strand:- start:2899 stop:4263 length:1365 start_codon:yes stop_codon:yes gene_type:complete
MNILTDVLSLIRRGIFSKTADPDDVLVLGKWNETPEMTGVASPIPYKSIKVIRIKDFKVAAEHCAHSNSPAIPTAGTGQFYQKTDVDATTQKCTVYFRSLKSMSSNLTLATSADDNYVEITTEGEPNLAANVGSGFQWYKNKIGETLNFRSIVQGAGVTVAQSTNEITISNSGASSLTTNGTSGVSTLVNGVLNIPNYAAGGGGGEINTASNVGGGVEVFKQKTGADLEFRTLTSLGGTVTITQTATTIDLAAASGSSNIESVIASGKVFMQYVSGSDGTGAMIGNNYKMMGMESVNHGTSTNIFSPYMHDWTTGGKFINSASSWTLPPEAVWNAGIPINKTLAIGDTITLHWQTTNSRETTSTPQVFNAVIGWFDCADATPWPVTLRDVQTGAGANGPVGPMVDYVQYQCASVTSTLTTAETFGYAVFGFNFEGGAQDDQYNIEWSISVNKAI